MLQFFNLTTCQIRKKHVNINRPEYRHVAKRGGAIGVDPFLSTVLFPIIIYWKNNKLALQILRIVYKNFILITHIDQNSNFQKQGNCPLHGLQKSVLTVCILNIIILFYFPDGWVGLLSPSSPFPSKLTFKLYLKKTRCHMVSITVQFCSSGYPDMPEELLLQTLFQKYNKNARPATTRMPVVNIDHSMDLIRINSFVSSFHSLLNANFNGQGNY